VEKINHQQKKENYFFTQRMWYNQNVGAVTSELNCDCEVANEYEKNSQTKKIAAHNAIF